MKCRFFILTAFLFMVIGWLYMGCSDAENNSVPEEPSIEMEGEVDVRPVIGSSGGTSTVTFTASGDWTASVSAVTRTLDWLSVSPTQGGAGTVTLQISAQPNESYDERNAAVLLTCGNAQQTITVTQKQKDALLVNSHKVEMDAEGGTFGIELQANVNVTYEIEEAAKDWLTASSSSSTRGLTTSTLNFQVAENPEDSVRQAVITLRGNDLTEEVIVYQAGSEPAILLSQKEYTVPSDGETIQVELKSNTSYKVVMPDAPWITETSTRAFSAYTHYFTVAVNESYDARTAEIYFVDEENGLQEKVTVTQVQKDAIVIAEDEYTMDAEGGRLEFTVNANVDFSVETSVDWIQQVDTRGLAEKSLQFNIAENTTEASRQGVITIRSGELKQEIRVIQEGKTKAYLIVSSKEFTVPAEGGNIEFVVEANAEVIVTSSASWCYWNVGSSYTFIVESNTQPQQRKAEILVECPEYGLSEVIYVMQEALVPQLDVLYKEVYVGADSWIIDSYYNISTNIDYFVKVENADWLSITNSKIIDVWTNFQGERRQAIVTVYNEEYGISQSYQLVQEAYPYLDLPLDVLTKGDINLPASEGSYIIPVHTDQEISIATDNPTWLTVMTEGNNIKIQYEANTSNEMRSATLFVKIGRCKISTNYQLFQGAGISSDGEIDDIIHMEW